jgi:hypothetical protein
VTAPTIAPGITADQLAGGEYIRYGGDLYRVAEPALPAAVLTDSTVVVAYPATPYGGWDLTRVALIYASTGPVDLVTRNEVNLSEGTVQ